MADDDSTGHFFRSKKWGQIYNSLCKGLPLHEDRSTRPTFRRARGAGLTALLALQTGLQNAKTRFDNPIHFISEHTAKPCPAGKGSFSPSLASNRGPAIVAVEPEHMPCGREPEDRFPAKFASDSKGLDAGGHRKNLPDAETENALSFVAHPIRRIDFRVPVRPQIDAADPVPHHFRRSKDLYLVAGFDGGGLISILKS